MLPPAAAANAVVHVDQVSADIACMRDDLLAQKRFRADIAYLRGIGSKVDPVSLAIALAKRFHALAGSLIARRTREQPARGNASAHHAFSLIFIRLTLSRAAARAGFLAKVAIAEHAIQPARGKHVDIDGVRWFHLAPRLSP